MRDGLIQQDPWGFVYKAKVNNLMKNYMMYLQDKHCFKTVTLNVILTNDELYKINPKSEIKKVFEMLRWQITAGMVILNFAPQVIEEVK